MKRNLSDLDKRIIKYSYRPGYLVSIIFVFMCFLFALGHSLYHDKEFNEFLGPAILLICFLGILILFLIIRPSYIDLKSDYKIVEKKKIQSKESKTDYEAGSATLYIGQKMNSFQAYSLIIDNTRSRVEPAFFDSVIEGEIIGFEFTSHKKHLLRMVKL